MKRILFISTLCLLSLATVSLIFLTSGDTIRASFKSSLRLFKSERDKKYLEDQKTEAGIQSNAWFFSYNGECPDGWIRDNKVTDINNSVRCNRK